MVDLSTLVVMELVEGSGAFDTKHFEFSHSTRVYRAGSLRM
jgi:hypothetical protein